MNSLGYIVSLFLLSVFIYRTNAGFGYGKCLDSPVLQNFDSKQYLGDWYEIERFDVIFEFDLKCVRVHYNVLNETAVSVNNTGIHVSTGAYSQTFGYAQAPDQTKPNQLLVYLPIKAGNQTLFNNTAHYNVWKTDYKTFSLVYSCEQVIDNLLKYEITWIISRKSTLDQSIVDGLKDFAKNRTLDVSKFIKVDQNC